MSESKLTFTLTGNFQYDLGILGLKKVLDFFGFEYESDNYSISVNKDDWLKIGKSAYFYGYYFNGLEQVKKKFKIKDNSLKGDDFKTKILEINDVNGDISSVFNSLKEFFTIPDKNKIEFVSYPALCVFNVSHLNIFNPGLLKKAKKDGNINLFYEMYISKFTEATLSNKLSDKTCDFCQKFDGKPLNRNNFLFASSAMNQGWFEKQNIHICPYCEALNLFVSYGTITTQTGERYLIYSSNLRDLENDNKILASKFEELISKYLEDIIKVETNAKDKLFIKMVFSGQNPDIDFLPLSSELITFLLENKDLISRLKENDFTGIAKQPIISGYKDTIESLINGEDLFFKADFIVSCIIKQQSGNRNFSGFDDRAIKEVFNILEISIKRRGGSMNLGEFINFGDDIRKRLYVGKSQNAAKNKAISFASSMRDAVNESKEKFMEIILQLSIYSQLPIPQSLINKINDSNFNYKEAGLAIALALMSKKEE